MMAVEIPMEMKITADRAVVMGITAAMGTHRRRHP